jgi:hypothetical protein
VEIQRKFTLFLIIPIILLLSGCRIILFSSEGPLIEKLASKQVQLDSKVFIKRNTLTIRNETTFPPGTILSIVVRPYPVDSNLLNIQTYAIEAKKDIVISRDIIVKEDGTMDAIMLNRPDPTKRYLLQITFLPEKQEEEVKDIFGEKGETLQKGAAVEEIQKGSYIYSKYINLMSIEDPDGIGASLDFLSKSEIEEMYHQEKQ